LAHHPGVNRLPLDWRSFEGFLSDADQESNPSIGTLLDQGKGLKTNGHPDSNEDEERPPPQTHGFLWT
jgi:hypothetical protein